MEDTAGQGPDICLHCDEVAGIVTLLSRGVGTVLVSSYREEGSKAAPLKAQWTSVCLRIKALQWCLSYADLRSCGDCTAAAITVLPLSRASVCHGRHMPPTQANAGHSTDVECSLLKP